MIRAALITGRLRMALAAAGFAPTRLVPAKAARPRSVAYAAAEAADAARTVAEALTGGATAERLTWKADADLVVAIGDSARGPQ